VILIGEIRDRETMEHALAFADTGHLAISTLHANNANQALDRIINFFPEERRPQLLNDLGNNLKAFVSQRLVRTQDGKRRAAVEVLLGTATISDIIKRGDFSSIKEIMDKSRALGMQTFDQALFDLAVEGAITEEEAVKNADSANNLRLKLKLYKDNPGSVGSAATPAAAKPAAPAPVAPAVAAQPVEASSWGLELALEEIEAEDADKPAGQ
jgi:twitching motility protein PilU